MLEVFSHGKCRQLLQQNTMFFRVCKSKRSRPHQQPYDEYQQIQIKIQDLKSCPLSFSSPLEDQIRVPPKMANLHVRFVKKKTCKTMDQSAKTSNKSYKQIKISQEEGLSQKFEKFVCFFRIFVAFSEYMNFNIWNEPVSINIFSKMSTLLA